MSDEFKDQKPQQERARFTVVVDDTEDYVLEEIQADEVQETEMVPRVRALEAQSETTAQGFAAHHARSDDTQRPTGPPSEGAVEESTRPMSQDEVDAQMARDRRDQKKTAPGIYVQREGSKTQSMEAITVDEHQSPKSVAATGATTARMPAVTSDMLKTYWSAQQRRDDRHAKPTVGQQGWVECSAEHLEGGQLRMPPELASALGIKPGQKVVLRIKVSRS